MICIHDKRIPKGYINSLKEQLPGVEFVPFECPGSEVYESILCHPDIYMFQLDGRTLVHAPGLPGDFLKKLSDNGIELIEGERVPGRAHPHTTPYNVVRVGEVVFHNFENTDPVIIALINEKGLKTVNVPQGYARCSVLASSNGSIMTSDRKICEKAEKEGMGALLVPGGHIELPGEEYGFIGGCGGLTPEGKVVVLGDLGLHPAASEIEDFIGGHCQSCVQVKCLPLYDAGGLFFV